MRIYECELGLGAYIRVCIYELGLGAYTRVCILVRASFCYFALK